MQTEVIISGVHLIHRAGLQVRLPTEPQAEITEHSEAHIRQEETVLLIPRPQHLTAG